MVNLNKSDISLVSLFRITFDKEEVYELVEERRTFTISAFKCSITKLVGFHLGYAILALF